MRGGSVARWLGYLLLSVVLTWPLALRLSTHLPLGALGDPTVPYFNLWTLEWNAERLLRGYAGYWDAPLFFPARDTFAMSEPQAVTGLVFAPLAWLCGPVLAYNLTLFVQLLLNGWAGWRLLRVLSASELAAALGGALFLGLPFVRHELGVLQLCAAWPVLLALTELVHLSRSASGAAVVRFGLWLVVSAWTCVYYALFLGLFALVAAACYVRRAFWSWLFVRASALGLVIVVVGLYPLYAAERRAVLSHTRSKDAIHSGSGSVLAYLEFPRGTLLAELVPAWSRPAGRRSLYPGAVICVLALAGVLHARRSHGRRLACFTLLLFILALFLSFGTRWEVFGVTPYAFTAQRYVPGFAQLRSPYRAALFVQLVLTACAGLGLSALMQARRVRSSPLLAAGAALCVALALAEVSVWGFALSRFPSERLEEPWIAWLARQPAGAVAMLPVTAGGQASAYAETVLGMLQALRHEHPIVNGYSGFFPARTDVLMGKLRKFPDAAGLTALRRVPVRYVVVDQRWPGAHAFTPVPQGLTLEYSQPPRSVYVVH